MHSITDFQIKKGVALFDMFSVVFKLNSTLWHLNEAILMDTTIYSVLQIRRGNKHIQGCHSQGKESGK